MARKVKAGRHEMVTRGGQVWDVLLDGVVQFRVHFHRWQSKFGPQTHAHIERGGQVEEAHWAYFSDVVKYVRSL